MRKQQEIILDNSSFYRPLQKKILQDNKSRFTCWRAGRRSGKTTGARRWKLTEAITGLRPELPSFWVSPIIETARKVFEHFLREYKSVITDFNLSRREILLPNGRRIFFVGCDNPGSIEGEGAWSVVLDEVRHIKNPLVWEETLRPMLADAAAIGGGRALLISTPGFRGHWFSEYCDSIESHSDPERWEGYTSYTTKTIESMAFEGLEKEIEIARRTLPPDIFRRNFEAIETLPGDLVYSEFGDHNLVEDSFYVPPAQITCGLDFGSSETHPTAFIPVCHGMGGNDHLVLGEQYLYNTNMIEVIDTAKKIRDQFKVSMFFCDHNRPDYFREFKKSGLPVTLANKESVIQGVELVRSLLYKPENSPRPKLFFIKSKTKKLQEELLNYSFKGSTDIPDKGPNNDHGLDALRYDIVTYLTNRGGVKYFYD